LVGTGLLRFSAFLTRLMHAFRSGLEKTTQFQAQLLDILLYLLLLLFGKAFELNLLLLTILKLGG